MAAKTSRNLKVSTGRHEPISASPHSEQPQSFTVTRTATRINLNTNRCTAEKCDLPHTLCSYVSTKHTHRYMYNQTHVHAPPNPHVHSCATQNVSVLWTKPTFVDYKTSFCKINHTHICVIVTTHKILSSLACWHVTNPIRHTQFAWTQRICKHSDSAATLSQWTLCSTDYDKTKQTSFSKHDKTKKIVPWNLHDLHLNWPHFAWRSKVPGKSKIGTLPDHKQVILINFLPSA